MAAALFTVAAGQLDYINNTRSELNLVSNEPLENAPPSLAFATVAMGAFRGLVVDILWIRAERLKQEGQFFDAKQLAEWITTLQPRFVSVWDWFSDLLRKRKFRRLRNELRLVERDQVPERFDTPERSGGRIRGRITPEQRQYFFEHSTERTAAEWAEEFGVSLSTIYRRCDLSGKKTKSTEFWSPAKDKFLVENYETMGDKEIAARLGEPCTDKMVTTRLRKFGLKRTPFWDAKKDRFIRDNLRSMSNDDLATLLGTTRSAIVNRIHRLGLKRSKA